MSAVLWSSRLNRDVKIDILIDYAEFLELRFIFNFEIKRVNSNLMDSYILGLVLMTILGWMPNKHANKSQRVCN